LDIETLSINRNGPIIEFAAVIDDLSMPLPVKNLPKFHRYVTHETYNNCEPYAMAMHSEKLYRIADPKKHPEYKFSKNDFLTKDFAEWLLTNGYSKNAGGRISINAAGKNFAGFDLQFINKLPYFDSHFNISNMVLDPGPMYVTAKDVKCPDLDECIKRAGLEGMEVTHDGMNEAIVVVELIRTKLIDGYKPK
jgi:hypothetical protein